MLAPAALTVSSDVPSPLNASTSLEVTSSAGIVSSVRQSASAESRTSTS